MTLHTVWEDVFTNTDLSRYDYIEASGGGATGIVEITGGQLHINVNATNPHYSYVDKFIRANDFKITADIKTVQNASGVEDFNWINFSSDLLTGWLFGITWDASAGQHAWGILNKDGTIASGSFAGNNNTTETWVFEYHTSPHTLVVTVNGVTKINYTDSTSGSSAITVADFNFCVANDSTNDNRGDLYVDNLTVESDVYQVVCTGVAVTDITSSSSSWTINLPLMHDNSNVPNGDLLLAFFTTNTSTNFSGIAGWTQIDSEVDDGTDYTVFVLRRIASGEGSTFAMTSFINSNEVGRCVVLAYRGIDPTTPINTSNTRTAATGTSVAGPSVTPSVDNCMIVQMFGTDPGTGTYTGARDTAPQATERFDGKDGSNNAYIYIQDYRQGAKAAIALDATSLVSDSYAGYQVAIAPYVPPTPAISGSTPSTFNDADTGIVLAGTGFEASQGAGIVELGDSATYASANKQEQTVTAWSDTSITITAALGSLTPGMLYLFVTNNDGQVSSGFSVTVHRAIEIVLAASANIATSAATDTTAQLTAPAGKTTSDFTAGKISDDTNPVTIDIAGDFYTEVEWAIKFAATAAVTDYVFRITRNGVPLDTYSVTPQLTVATINTYDVIVDGTITAAGVLVKQTNKIFSGSITATGDLIKTIAKILNGSITASGALAAFKSFLVELSGSITAAGELLKTTTKLLDGSITAAGELVKTINKIFSGSVTAAGDLIKTTAKILDGSITAAGDLIKTAMKILDGSIDASGDFLKTPQKVLSGSITAAGTLLKDTFKVLDGSITAAGELLKNVFKTFSGSITATGDLIKTITKVLDGSISASGDLLKQCQKVLSGSITASGSLARDIFKVLSGAITATGDLIKTTTKVLSGTITATGDLSTFKILLLVLDGSITASGELFKTTTKNLSGDITAAGELLKTTIKSLSGSITSSGELVTVKTFLLELAGSITATGDLIKTTYKNFAGSIIPSGDFLKTPNKILSGTITSSGNLIKSTTKILGGNIQATGELLRQTQKILSGSIALSGALIKTPQKILTGSITFTGSLVKNTVKVMSGSITPTGGLTKSTKKILEGLITASGNLSSSILGEFVTMPGQTARLRYRIQNYLNYWEAYVKRNDANDAWDFYVDKVEAGSRSHEFTGALTETPTAIRVIVDGNSHTVYTVENGLYVPQVTLTDAFLAGETLTNTLYHSVVIPIKHVGYKLTSTSYSVLDRE